MSHSATGRFRFHARERVLVCAALICGLAAALVAFPAAAESASKREAEKLVADARVSFEKLMADQKKAIPAGVLKKTRAVIIFPSVVKGGFIVGAKTGTGALLVKKGGSWVGPAFYNLGGMSVGALVGVQSIDIVMAVMTDKGLQPFMKQDFTIGTDASAVAGESGAREAKDIGEPLADLLTYSRVEGLFAGLSLDGGKIIFMDKVTSAYYGQPVTAKAVLLDGKIKPPPSADQLKAALNKVMASSDLVRDIQFALSRLGYDPGPTDGFMGGKTRSAIRAYEKSAGLPQTGAPSGALLTHLQARKQ